MKTIIFDIDGTLTDMWPIEKSVLLRMTGRKYKKEIEALKASGISDTFIIFTKAIKQKIKKSEYWEQYSRAFTNNLAERRLPRLKRYTIDNWIRKNRNNYRFVYATGGQNNETLYTLKSIGLFDCFDLKNSIDKNRCRFSKKTGIPFRMIKRKFPDSIVVADSENDQRGAIKAGIKFFKIKPDDSEATSNSILSKFLLGNKGGNTGKKQSLTDII